MASVWLAKVLYPVEQAKQCRNTKSIAHLSQSQVSYNIKGKKISLKLNVQKKFLTVVIIMIKHNYPFNSTRKKEMFLTVLNKCPISNTYKTIVT